MDGHNEPTPELDWEILSDTLGALSLVVIFLAALAAPGLL